VVKEQETVAVQTVIAYLETDGDVVTKETSKETAPTAEPKMTAESESVTPEATVSKGGERLAPTVQPLAKPMAGRFYSPLVMNIARTEGVSMSELERVPGSGTGGRVSKKDILAYVEAKKVGAPVSPVPSPGAPLERSVGVAAKPVEVPELRKKYPAPDHDILQMSTVLQKMAEHMVKSVHTSPHVEAIHEVDMTNIVKHRNQHAAEFEKKEGFKLTFTPYIVDAVVKAIKKYPLVNSSVEGDKIIKKNFVNLGIAVASDNGLIVPVVKHAERKSFLGLARAVNDLASRTRNKKLTPEDVQGGTFTISNFGVFGTMVGTPIINQPQVAILGTGAIKKRVVVIDDAIAIRSTAYFTLSFDHRIVDGALGGVFLEEIVQKLQNFDTSMKF
jgi:2-oxoglutarate dehydrogenase E2 component (dihydrolipoamide succinyltransferase)